MRSVFFAFRLRFRLWRNLLLAAAAAGLIQFVAVLFLTHVVVTRGSLAMHLAASMAAAAALMLGAVTDRQERALLLRLPIRLGGAWLGGLAADLFLAAAVGVLVLFPSCVGSREIAGEVWRTLTQQGLFDNAKHDLVMGVVQLLMASLPTSLSERVWRILYALVFLRAPLVLLALWSVARVVGLLFSDRSSRIALDLGAAVLFLSIIGLQTHVYRTWLVYFFLVIGLAILPGAAMIASAAHACLGRLDTRRAHYLLSSILWTPLLLVGLSGVAWVARVATLKPGGLHAIFGAEVSPRGDWAFLWGWGWFNEFYFLAGVPETHAAGVVHRFDLAHYLTFSEDGRRAAWQSGFQRNTIWSLDLADSGAEVQRCSLFSTKRSDDAPLMLDASGERVAIVEKGLIRILDPLSCTVEASIPIPNGRILDATPVRESSFHLVLSEKTHGGEAAGQAYHVVDVDTREKTAVLRGTIIKVPGQKSFTHFLDADADRFLLGDRDTIELFDVGTGRSLARFDADSPDRHPVAFSLPDERLLLLNALRSASKPRVTTSARILDADGALIGPSFDLASSTALRDACALSPERILLGASPQFESYSGPYNSKPDFQQRIVLLDLARATSQSLDGPSFPAWTGNHGRTSHGPCWFYKLDGTFVEVTDGDLVKLREVRF